jgi:hypothetical protein
MNRIYLFLLGSLAFLTARSAGATVITIDPASYASGTNVSTMFEGLTISVLENRANALGTYNPTSLQAIVDACAIGPCGDPGGPTAGIGGIVGMAHHYDFCFQRSRQGLTSQDCRDSWIVLELQFESGTDYVEIDSIWNSDLPGLWAYDSQGNLVDMCYMAFPTASLGTHTTCSFVEGSSNGSGLGTTTLRSDTTDIARVIFGGWVGAGTVTGISYSVPEPGSLSAFLVGLSGIYWTTRKRRTFEA